MLYLFGTENPSATLNADYNSTIGEDTEDFANAVLSSLADASGLNESSLSLSFHESKTRSKVFIW